MAVFEDLIEALAQPTEVTELALYGDDLRPTDLILPEEVDRLVNLERLYLGQWLEVSLPASLATLPRLREVQLEECCYMEIPEVMFAVKALRELHLSAPSADKMLPAAIGGLSQLEVLSFWGLKGLSEALSVCKQLRALDISHGDFEAIPRVVGNLPALRQLDVSYTGVDELPRWFTSLPIEVLRLNQGPAHIFPKWSKKKVQQIRQSWGEMRYLRELSLAHQHVIDVSSHVREWTQLLRLGLSYNAMTEVPDEIGLIPNLEYLDLRANQLSDLPAAWAGWKAPLSIDLSQNPITRLPSVLQAIPKLRSVVLAGTPIAKGDRDFVHDALPGVNVQWEFS